MPSSRLMVMLAIAIVCGISTMRISVVDAEKPPIKYHDDHNNWVRLLKHQVIQASPWPVDDSQNASNGSSVTLTAYPPMLDDGSDLVISYTNVPTPHIRDYIALSCGPLAHPNDYLIKQDLNSSNPRFHPQSSSSAAASSVRFSSLYMMRCTYLATYYNYVPKLDDFKAIGSIEIPMKESFNAPKHGHISFTSQVDEMAVMFNSASNRTPWTEYGTDPQNLTFSTNGTSTTYRATDMCEAPANLSSQQWFRDPGYMHTVILQQLLPLTTYYYRFGNSEDGWSAVYSFVSRASSSSSKHAKFLAYADMGVESAPAATSTATRSFQEVVENGYNHFLLHIGDISYARGHAHVWDEFFHIIESYATNVPYLISIGNHEYDYISGGTGHDPSGAVDPKTNRMAFTPSWGNYGPDSGGECSVPMFHRWHTPSNGHGIYWYSFNERGVHVIQLSSEHDWSKGSVQYRWLEEDLQKVDRQETPWIVLTSHRMMYTTQLGEDADLKVSIHYREEMEELLWKYRVNLMLVGHQHSYERSCPVYKGECTKDGIGPVHLVVGSAGAGLETQGFSDVIGKWSVSHVNDWGYLRVESTEEEMKIDFILNRNGVVYDHVTLKPWE